MKELIILYIMYYIQISLHELAHYVAAKKFKLSIVKAQIGNDILSFKIGEIYISPIAFPGGYVEIEAWDDSSVSQIKLVLFFLSGSIVNLTFGVFALLLSGKFIFNVFSLMGIIIAISNSLFFIPDTDMYNVFRVILRKTAKGSKL